MKKIRSQKNVYVGVRAAIFRQHELEAIGNLYGLYVRRKTHVYVGVRAASGLCNFPPTSMTNFESSKDT